MFLLHRFVGSDARRGIWVSFARSCGRCKRLGRPVVDMEGGRRHRYSRRCMCQPAGNRGSLFRSVTIRCEPPRRQCLRSAFYIATLGDTFEFYLKYFSMVTGGVLMPVFLGMVANVCFVLLLACTLLPATKEAPSSTNAAAAGVCCCSGGFCAECRRFRRIGAV